MYIVCVSLCPALVRLVPCSLSNSVHAFLSFIFFKFIDYFSPCQPCWYFLVAVLFVEKELSFIAFISLYLFSVELFFFLQGFIKSLFICTLFRESCIWFQVLGPYCCRKGVEFLLRAESSLFISALDNKNSLVS